MPYIPKTHTDYRGMVCLLCFGKAKDMRKITDVQRETIEKSIISGLDSLDERLPTALCSTCRKNVSNISNGAPNHIKHFDYSKLGSKRPETRSSSCDCLVCLIGPTKFSFQSANAKFSTKKCVGRPLSSSPQPDPSPIKVCSACLTELSKGKPHNCNKTTRELNIQSMLESGDCKSGEKITSKILKEYKTLNESNTFSLSQFRGQPLRVELFPAKKKDMTLTCEEMKNIKKNIGLTSRQTLKLATGLRIATKRRCSVVPGLKDSLTESNKQVDQYFSVKDIKFDEEETVTPVVYCTDIKGFIDFVLLQRREFSEDVEMKLGLDSGGGFFKICLNVFSHCDFENLRVTAKKQKYSEGFPEVKTTSVGKLIILALAQNVKETFLNVSKIYQLLKIEEIEKSYKIRVAADFKMLNILLGLMAHSSTHPCSYCDIKK